MTRARVEAAIGRTAGRHDVRERMFGRVRPFATDEFIAWWTRGRPGLFLTDCRRIRGRSDPTTDALRYPDGTADPIQSACRSWSRSARH